MYTNRSIIFPSNVEFAVTRLFSWMGRRTHKESYEYLLMDILYFYDISGFFFIHILIYVYLVPFVLMHIFLYFLSLYFYLFLFRISLIKGQP